jgi:DNA-binding NarL/FixJ family response regulator
MNRPRVLIAEDHTLVSGAFQKLLEPHYDVVGTVADGRALLKEAPELKPDIVVLDIGMPLLNGLDAGHQLKQLMPNVKLIFLTMNQDSAVANQAFRMGASAYLLKNSAASELLKAIQEVLRGGSYVTPQTKKGMMETFIRDPRATMRTRRVTDRQREVLQLIAEGHSMKQVADILNVTPRTVAFHKYRMMEELGITSTAELIQFAIKQSIVPAA